MFQQFVDRKFSKIGVVLLIVLATCVGFGQSPDEPVPLQIGKTIERQIKAGEMHGYSVELKTGEVLRIEVEENGVDLGLFVFKPPEGRLRARSLYNNGFGYEALTYIAEEAGSFAVGIVALPKLKSGGYKLFGQTKAQAAEVDFQRVKAETLLLEMQSFNVDSDAATLRGKIKDFESLLPIWKAAGEPYWEAHTRIFLAGMHRILSEKKEALEHYKQALLLTKGVKHKEVEIFKGIGLTYISLGDWKTALDYLLKAKSAAEITNDKEIQAVILIDIGVLFANLDDHKTAAEYYQKALEPIRASGSKSKEAILLNNLGASLTKTGEKSKAMEYLKESLEISRKMNFKSTESFALNSLGAATDNYQEAAFYYNQGLQLARFVGDKDSEARLLWNLMYISKFDNRRLAVVYGKQSVNKYQDLRRSLRDLDRNLQTSFLDKIQSSYKTLAEILIEEGRFAEAQQVLAMLKEEEYFEYVRRDADEIKNLKGNIKLKPDEQKLVERYDLLAGRVTQIGAEFQALDDKKRKLPEGASLPAEQQKRYEELTAQLSDANAAFKLFLEKELAAELGKSVKKEIDVDRSLQEKLRSWGDGTVALYTIAGEDRYRVILTTPTSQTDAKTEIKAADLNKKIFAFRAALQNPAIDPRPLGKELYDILIKPIEKDLLAANAKTLIWSLDGTLRYIPLAALSPDGKNYLVEKYQSVLITSVTRQSLSAANETDWRTLGLGVSTAQTVADPSLPDEKISFSALPGVKTELATIVKDENATGETGLLAGKRLIDADFNSKNFGDSLTKETADGRRKYTIVHIASHFRLGDDAANSFLLLGGGNTLTLEQISNSPQMRFGDVELVTLSACNTAFGSGDSTGKEVDSLATFIELRGAKAILATLWSVADESTQLLMSEFYRLHKENPQMTKAEAMRVAQKQMIAGELKSSGKETGCRSEVVKFGGAKQIEYKCNANAPLAHPFYWSPFVLIGNWR